MVSFSTAIPSQFLLNVKAAISSGRIVTWAHDSDGDFTHTPPQWIYRAWLRPHIENGNLRFTIIGRNDTVLSKEIYAIYHGRFLEMMLAHFDEKFSASTSTAMPAAEDSIGRAA
jgi:hypothetical protein